MIKKSNLYSAKLFGRKYSKNIAFCFHDISDDDYNWSYAFKDLKKFIKMGLDEGLVFATQSFERQPLASRIQFDDGYQSTLKAVEWLTEKNIHCTLFICTGLVGSSFNGRQLIDEIALRDLVQNPFVTLGSHTATHARLSHVSVEEQVSETRDSFNYLFELGAAWSRELAYPWGDQNISINEIVEANGFKFAWTTNPGNINLRTLSDPYLLPRLVIRNDYTPEFLLNRNHTFAAVLDKLLP